MNPGPGAGPRGVASPVPAGTETVQQAFDAGSYLCPLALVPANALQKLFIGPLDALKAGGERLTLPVVRLVAGKETLDL
jgi:hypothetical protein